MARSILRGHGDRIWRQEYTHLGEKVVPAKAMRCTKECLPQYVILGLHRKMQVDQRRLSRSPARESSDYKTCRKEREE